MRHINDRWRQRLNPVFLFVGYRWLAWLSAGLALTLPGYAIDSLPKHASLLLVVLLVTLVITPQAMNYLRLMQRRPLLLILDVLLGWLVVTLSGGAFLPFGPYALGSLIAPALLFGWQGALIGGISVGVLNLISSSILAVADPAGIQAGVPLLFALGWAALAAWQRIPMDRQLGQSLPPFNASSSPVTLRHSTLPGSEQIGTAPEWYPPAITGASSRRGAELAPAVSLRPDLRLAIIQLVDGERERGGLQVACQIDGAVQKLTLAQQNVLLRAAQEALANVRRHAHASSCKVWLHVGDQAVTLQVEDDGVGLLDGTYERPHLHALRALRYRIAELDGQLAVFEGEQGGLTVRVTLPLGS